MAGPADRRILAFPFHDWRKSQAEGFRTRDAHVLTALARRVDVGEILVIDRPTSLVERRLRKVAIRASGDVVETWREGSASAVLTRVGAKTLVLDVALGDIVGPVVRRRGWWFDVFARTDVESAVQHAVTSALRAPTDVVAWMPTVAPLWGKFGGRLVLDSLDNWLIHPVLRRHAKEASAGYAAMVPAADDVIASGPASAQLLQRWREHVRVVPNGVDPTVFAGPTVRPADLPDAPIVGYVGKLAERIDDEFVAAVAAAAPGVSLVFVGPVLAKSAVRQMSGRANVVLLGDRPYDQMPAYLRAFDVAWIPHRVGEGETGGDPIKLYEYWAAGRQVISTRIDGSAAWAEQAWLVDDAKEAGTTIHGLLDGTISPLPTTVPPERTWDAIAASLLGEPPATGAVG